VKTATRWKARSSGAQVQHRLAKRMDDYLGGNNTAHTECLRKGTVPVGVILLLNYCKSETSLDVRPLSKSETPLRLIVKC